jgi:hypothetical protein
MYFKCVPTKLTYAFYYLLYVPHTDGEEGVCVLGHLLSFVVVQ